MISIRFYLCFEGTTKAATQKRAQQCVWRRLGPTRSRMFFSISFITFFTKLFLVSYHFYNDNDDGQLILQRWRDDVGRQQITYGTFFCIVLLFLLTKCHCYNDNDATMWNDNDDGQLIAQRWRDNVGWRRWRCDDMEWQQRRTTYATTLTQRHGTTITHGTFFILTKCHCF